LKENSSTYYLINFLEFTKLTQLQECGKRWVVKEEIITENFQEKDYFLLF
jgi:hypothetical protein